MNTPPRIISCTYPTCVQTQCPHPYFVHPPTPWLIHPSSLLQQRLSQSLSQVIMRKTGHLKIPASQTKTTPSSSPITPGRTRMATSTLLSYLRVPVDACRPRQPHIGSLLGLKVQWPPCLHIILTIGHLEKMTMSSRLPQRVTTTTHLLPSDD